MFDNPFDFGLGATSGAGGFGGGGNGFDFSGLFGQQLPGFPQPGAAPAPQLDPAMLFAQHLGSQGVTPDQFMKDPSVASSVLPGPASDTKTPSLGDSLAGPVPLPAPAPVPKSTMATSANASADAPAASTAPRGIRNNNPLNIESGGFTQSMPGYAGSDGRFAKFQTPEHGTAAANALLDSYRDKYGLNTPAGIIGRWAPASDGNDVNAYSKFVADKLGIDVNAPIPPEKRNDLISAMSEYENGKGGGTTTTASAKTAAAGSTIGDRLGKTLSGVKAPAPPTVQKVSTPSVPHGGTTAIKGGDLVALLQALGQSPQTPKPYSLSTAVGR